MLGEYIHHSTYVVAREQLVGVSAHPLPCGTEFRSSDLETNILPTELSSQP